MNLLHPTASPTGRRLNLSVWLLLSLLVTGGCASTGEQYAWSHSMSGDYLFAYDRGQCEQQNAGDTAGAGFFGCMQNLGYFLIDPTTGAD